MTKKRTIIQFCNTVKDWEEEISITEDAIIASLELLFKSKEEQDVEAVLIFSFFDKNGKQKYIHQEDYQDFLLIGDDNSLIERRKKGVINKFVILYNQHKGIKEYLMNINTLIERSELSLDDEVFSVAYKLLKSLVEKVSEWPHHRKMIYCDKVWLHNES